MFKKYREILQIPGALRFSLAGLIARFPMALVGISTILMIKALYGNYALAGFVSGTGVVAYGIGAPLLSRLVDQYGQSKVMIPALLASAVGVAALILAASNHAPPWVLLVLVALSGVSAGSMGAMVRARWAHVTVSPGQIQSAYSLEAAFDEVAYIIGPVTATLLATAVNPTAGMWLTIFFTIVGGIWFLTQKDTEPPVQPHQRETGARSVMLNPAMIVLAFTFAGTGALFGASDLAVVAFTAEQGAPQLAGVLLAVFAFGSLLGALIYGSRNWTWPLWKLFAVGIVALALGSSTFAFAKSIPFLGIVMVITGFTIAPTITNVTTIIQQIMPAGRLTEGLAWLSTSVNLGVAVGSGVTGPLIDSVGARGGFLVVIASAWFMAVAMLLGLRTLRHETTKGASRLHDLMDPHADLGMVEE